MTKKAQEFSIYNKLGYNDRYHYFSTLADTFKIDVMKILIKAEQLGIEQDFDGLLKWLQEQKDVI